VGCEFFLVVEFAKMGCEILKSTASTPQHKNWVLVYSWIPSTMFATFRNFTLTASITTITVGSSEVDGRRRIEGTVACI
jgi:hypothetical protein